MLHVCGLRSIEHCDGKAPNQRVVDAAALRPTLTVDLGWHVTSWCKELCFGEERGGIFWNCIERQGKAFFCRSKRSITQEKRNIEFGLSFLVAWQSGLTYDPKTSQHPLGRL